MFTSTETQIQSFTSRFSAQSHLAVDNSAETEAAKTYKPLSPLNISDECRCDGRRLGVFCCLEDRDSNGGKTTRGSSGCFSLSSFLPKRESLVFSDFNSLLAFGGDQKRCVDFSELKSDCQHLAFENLRVRLSKLLDSSRPEN